MNIPYREVVNIKLNTTAKRRFGSCRELEEGKFEIEIAERHLRDGVSQITLMNTMLHELLHTCDGCMNHGKLWKSYAARLNEIGYTIERCATAAEMAEAPDKESDFKYKVICDKCGREWKYMRRGSVVRSLQRNPKSCTCICGSRSFKLEYL